MKSLARRLNVQLRGAQRFPGEAGKLRLRLASLVQSTGHIPSCGFTACTCGAVEKQRDALLAATKLLRGDE